MTFQTQVGANMAPGIAGQFASANPRYSVLAGPGGLIAGKGPGGVGGVLVGRFAWLADNFLDQDNAPAVVNNFGSGPVAGFIHNEQQGLITLYLEEASMAVPSGMPITVLDDCEVWVKNSGASAALVGMKAYANYADGLATFDVAGAGGSASGSASSIAAAATNTFTGRIVNNVLYVDSALVGAVALGATLSGAGVASGTKITAQLSGTPHGVGTYSVNIPGQSVASTTITGTSGVLTVGGTVAGSFGVGDVLSGTNVVTGTKITEQLTGTPGGAGTYSVDNATVVGSTAITAGLQTETNWICRSYGAPGEVVKISQVRTYS
mgnify:FL=1